MLAHLVVSCNEQVCASMVSKCMLTASCKCDLKNCSCCKECYNCLSYLYSECCSCVGLNSSPNVNRKFLKIKYSLFRSTDMCPKPNGTRNALSKKSHVEELEAIPGLFKALTDVADEEEKWSTFSFPVDFDAALYGAKLDKDFKFYLRKTFIKVNEFGVSNALLKYFYQIQQTRNWTRHWKNVRILSRLIARLSLCRSVYHGTSARQTARAWVRPAIGNIDNSYTFIDL